MAINLYYIQKLTQIGHNLNVRFKLIKHLEENSEYALWSWIWWWFIENDNQSTGNKRKKIDFIKIKNICIKEYYQVKMAVHGMVDSICKWFIWQKLGM